VAGRSRLIQVLEQNAIDIFCVAHTLGWFFKALILRDYWFCWVRVYRSRGLQTLTTNADLESGPFVDTTGITSD
jgi:hypothetical protein